MRRALVPLVGVLAVVLAPTTAEAGKPVKTIQFALATYAGNETSSGAIVAVTRTWSNATASVLLSTVGGGTATAGSDYSTTTNLILNFGRGVTHVLAQVNLINDGVFDESPETVNLGLSGPSKGATLGSPSTATLTITDDNTPAAPVISAVTGSDDGEVDLSWAAVPGATGYDVWRGTTSGSYESGPFPTGGATSVTDTAARGTTYYYVVYASNINGLSPQSNEASATTSGTPVPTELILNGDFETGDFTSWSTGKANYDSFLCGTNSDEACYPPLDDAVVTTDQAHGGTYSAFLGNTTFSSIEPNGDVYIFQGIDVPAFGATTLSFWHLDSTTDNVAWDQQAAYIVNTNTDEVVLTALYVADSTGWVQTTADLTPFAGMQLTVFLQVHQDGASDPTNMYVDDVSVVNLA